MFKNMKLGTRLGVGFGLIILILGVLVFYSISGFVEMNSSIDRVVNDRMVKTRQTQEMINYINKTAQAIRNMFLLQDEALIRQEEEVLPKVAAIMTDLLDSVVSTTNTEEGKRLLGVVNEKREPFLDSRKRMLDLFEAGKKAEAQTILLGEYSRAQDDYVAAVTALITYQTDLASSDGKGVEDYSASAQRMLALMALMALILGVSASILITKSITKPVNRCIVIADKVAAGDTKVQINVDSNDEFGKLLAAMKRMVEAIQRMSADATLLAKSTVDGQLSVRADASKHQGDFRQIIQGVNDTLDSVIKPLNVTAKYVDDLSKGVIPPPISENYNGDFNIIKKNVNSVVKVMNDLLHEIDTLVNGAVNGNLAIRANTVLFVGGWNQLVSGVNKTLDSVVEPINESSAALEKVAARDLTIRVKGDYKGDHAKIKVSLNLALDNLEQAFAQVVQSTSQVASASGQISAGSQSLAQGANEQASSLEEVSSSLEEMASMTRQNAENATQAKTLSTTANENARVGADAMSRMSSAINRIKESSDQTAKIVKTIDEIAMQTNLLALNAAVEAARAGEAGRGFAVVAEEVRNLAQRSAQAAKNTADMIGESVKNADDGVKIAQEVSKSFDDIATGSHKVNDLIAEIAAASKEQSQGIEQVNSAVSQMDKVTQQNAANSEESASAAEELSSQAQELQAMVSQFRIAQATSVQRTATLIHHASKGSPQLTPPPKIGKTPSTKFVKRAVSSEEVIPLDDETLKEF